ncbi:MAG TPA: serine/threonine-protein kinase [Planctomycetaceae bacterium]|jgi:serine/threonine protein kinase|nr:serine/threonine-protein kinase [Planctomycetaceae bacterium]
MQYTPAVEDFVTCLKRSGLIAESEADSIIDGLAQAGVDVTEPKKIAAALVRNETLTKWQAENLLRGKRRGFMLGKYRLLGLLGRGANSSVYIAEHSMMRRRCAIKVLPVKSRSSSGLPRFQQEARAVALLDHTNIVRAYDLGQEKDGKAVIHYFVMELVEGESFEERLVREGPLPAVEAANLIRQAADGLAHAHAVGIIHRDVKPANLLIDRLGVVKILDLGLAKISDILATDESPVLGTADFMAPEQALDAKTADARSDVYSLGCTFYFLLCGQVPFAGGTLSERLVRHLFETPVALARKRSDLPEDLTSIVQRMLIKNPAERIQTTAEVSNLLRNWLLRHADRNWLRANPALLNSGRAGETQESTASAGDAVPGRAASAGSAVPIEGSGDAFQLVPVMDPPGSAAGFLDSHEFDIPISPVTRSLMKNREHSTWRTWLARASKRFRRE